jgi:cell division protein FtsB
MKFIKKIILSLVLILVFSALIKNLINYKEKYQFYLGFEKEYQRLKKENIELKTELLRKKDRFEIEKKIREKLNLGGEGETVIILPPQPTPQPTVITPTPKPNWQQWIEVFF